MTRDEARSIIDKVLKMSRADEASASIENTHEANIRYGRNEVSTSGDTSNATLTVRSTFGRRSGAATINQFDDDSLRRVVSRSEETAKFAREDPEYMAMLGPQKYDERDVYDAATADTPPEYRANIAAKAIELGTKRSLETAGFFTNSGTIQALGNSKGLFAFDRSTFTTFSNTIRTTGGSSIGSGWAGTNATRIADYDPLKLIEVAAKKAELSKNARQLPAGEYTVILEPSAVADLLLYLSFAMDARSADEGRTFFAKKGGGSKIGEKVVSEKVTILTDPGDVRAPGSVYGEGGLPTRLRPIIENGVLKSLGYSRFWAQKMNAEPTPAPTNLIMKGGKGTLDDLVRGTKDGILVTRFWYIRSLDPQAILLTGLTRDGVFKIENGKIRYAVKNFRWNDSPVSVLSKVDAMSQEYRGRGAEAEDFAVLCPAIRTRFNFSSLSEAV